MCFECYTSLFLSIFESDCKELQIFGDGHCLLRCSYAVAARRLCFPDLICTERKILLACHCYAGIVGNQSLDFLTGRIIYREFSSDEHFTCVRFLEYTDAAAFIGLILVIEVDHFFFDLVSALHAPAVSYDHIGIFYLKMILPVRELIPCRRFCLFDSVLSKRKALGVVSPAGKSSSVGSGNDRLDHISVLVIDRKLCSRKIFRSVSVLLSYADSAVHFVIDAHDGEQVLLGRVSGFIQEQSVFFIDIREFLRYQLVVGGKHISRIQ